MGCQVSNPEEFGELSLEHDLPPTVISSLNSSAIVPFSQHKLKHSIYTHSKFLKIKSLVTSSLQDLCNFDEINKILDLWEDLVLKKIEKRVEFPSELTFFIHENTKPEITIHLQADGLSKFGFLSKFLKRLKDMNRIMGLDTDTIKENEEFIRELRPLTVDFYLVLGKEVDFGIGVNKAIDRKNLSIFLQNSSDRKTLTQWSYMGNMPIPISMDFSYIKPRKSCSFYIFEGEKNENFSRAFSIFDYIGAPLEESIKKELWAAKSHETSCKVAFEANKIVDVAVEVDHLPWTGFLNLVELLGLEVRCKQVNYSERVSIQLDKYGLNLVKYSDI